MSTSHIVCGARRKSEKISCAIVAPLRLTWQPNPGRKVREEARVVESLSCGARAGGRAGGFVDCQAAAGRGGPAVLDSTRQRHKQTDREARLNSKVIQVHWLKSSVDLIIAT